MSGTKPIELIADLAHFDRSPLIVREHPLLRVKSPAVREGLLLPFHQDPLQLWDELGAHVHLPHRRRSLRGLELPVRRDVSPDQDGLPA